MDYQNENISANNFEQCTKCAICTAYCPVTGVNPLYPGPKQAGADSERYRLKDPEFYTENLKYCLNCKRCEVACPSGVRIGDIILAARLKYSSKKPSLRDSMLASTDTMGNLASKCAPIANTTLAMKPVKYVLDHTLKIHRHCQLPKYSSTKFTTWYKKSAAVTQEHFSRHISYFHGCYVNYNYPALGKSLVAIYNAIGFGVRMLNSERCCGVAKIANRLIDEAKRDASINLGTIRAALAAGSEAVISTSSTCCFTIRDEYHHVLGLDNTDVRQSVTLASAHLARLISKGEAKLVFRSDYKCRIAYHTPCHMERLGFTNYSLSLLSSIPGVELIKLDTNCCGIAGSYGFKKENYEASQAIGAALFKQINDTKPDFVATDCETCKWQIEMSTSYKVKNPIEILHEALDIERTMLANGLVI